MAAEDADPDKSRPPSWFPADPSERRAIFFIDVVESVPLLDRHEADAVNRWVNFVHEVREQVLPRHGVRLIKSLGDGLRMLAPDAPRAAAAAQDILQRLAAYNQAADGDALLQLHTAIHVAPVAEDDLDIYGHGVNLAARLAAKSQPGQILLSGEANEQLLPGLDPPTEDLGDQWFKGIEEPVRVYAVCGQVAATHETLTAAPPAGAFKPTIAVLPFAQGDAVGSSSSSHTGLSLGELMADEIIAALSPMQDLHVVSRLSTSALAQRHGDVRAEAPVLGADYLVTGNCHAVGDRVVVHAELFDLRRCEAVFRHRETGAIASLADEESPLILALTARLTAAILDRQIDLARRCALPNLAGYTLLLGGIALMHRLSRRDFQRAHELLQHLTERWPRLAAPHAWLARWHLFSVLQHWSHDATRDGEAAYQASERALALDDESSVALAVAGSVRIGLSQDVAGGLALYDRALAANPNDSFAWMLRGTAHAFRGDGADAVRASDQARLLSPLDPLHFLYDCHGAAAALAADDPARARSLAERSLRANAQHLSTYRVLAIAQMLGGDGTAARDTVRRLLVLDPKATAERWLRSSPSAAYPIGQKFARLLVEAGMPKG